MVSSPLLTRLKSSMVLMVTSSWGYLLSTLLVTSSRLASGFIFTKIMETSSGFSASSWSSERDMNDPASSHMLPVSKTPTTLKSRLKRLIVSPTVLLRLWDALLPIMISLLFSLNSLPSIMLISPTFKLCFLIPITLKRSPSTTRLTRRTPTASSTPVRFFSSSTRVELILLDINPGELASVTVKSDPPDFRVF